MTMPALARTFVQRDHTIRLLPPIEVESATWSAGGTIDWWVKERREWLGRVRGPLVEIVATIKGDGFREPRPLIGPFPSGAPAIFIDQIGRLGTPAAIISCVGDDDFGRLNLDRLIADGVDVSGIEVAKGEATGSAFVRYRPDGSRAFVYNIAHSATGKLTVTPDAEAPMESCDHMHVMGTALSAPGLSQVARETVARITARGGTLSFDPNPRPEILDTAGLREALDEVLAQTNLFLPSGEEIYLFTEADDEAAAVKELLNRGVGDIVIKRGNQGASHFNRGGRTDAAYPLDERSRSDRRR